MFLRPRLQHNAPDVCCFRLFLIESDMNIVKNVLRKRPKSPLYKNDLILGCYISPMTKSEDAAHDRCSGNKLGFGRQLQEVV